MTVWQHGLAFVALATVADGQFVPVPGGVLVLQGDGTVIWRCRCKRRLI